MRTFAGDSFRSFQWSVMLERSQMGHPMRKRIWQDLKIMDNESVAMTPHWSNHGETVNTFRAFVLFSQPGHHSNSTTTASLFTGRTVYSVNLWSFDANFNLFKVAPMRLSRISIIAFVVVIIVIVVVVIIIDVIISSLSSLSSSSLISSSSSSSSSYYHRHHRRFMWKWSLFPKYRNNFGSNFFSVTVVYFAFCLRKV